MKKMERIFQIALLVAFIFMCVKACTRPIMLADYNRISGENRFMYEVRDRRVAYMIAKVIFLHYTKDIKNPTPQHYSFVWNGGGDAWKRVKRPKNDLKQKNLDSYWEKVKLYL